MNGRVRLHELMGRRVVDCDGKLVDHLADVVARPVDGRLAVTALLVGRRALFARVARRRWLGAARGPIVVPWQQVEELGEEVRLRVARSELPPAHRGRGREGAR